MLGGVPGVPSPRAKQNKRETQCSNPLEIRASSAASRDVAVSVHREERRSETGSFGLLNQNAHIRGLYLKPAVKIVRLAPGPPVKLHVDAPKILRSNISEGSRDSVDLSRIIGEHDVLATSLAEWMHDQSWHQPRQRWREFGNSRRGTTDWDSAEQTNATRCTDADARVLG